MDADWARSAVVGLILGSATFVLLFVPILVWESRRFGRLRPSRTLAAGLASIYGVTVLVYVFLPLPPSGWCEANGSIAPELEPFHSVAEIREATAGLSITQALGSFAVLQVVMNVVLFVPWGAFARRLFGRPWWVGVLSGLLMSVFIETTQGTGLWGFYGCAYRTADVDDVITNTTGAAIGVLLAPVLLWWVPKVGPDLAVRAEPRPLTRTRRLVAMLVDAASYLALWSVLVLLHRMFTYDTVRRTIADEAGWFDRAVPGAIAAVVVLVVPVLVGSRASLGQRAMWLRPEPRPGLARTAVRLVTGAGGWAIATLVEAIPDLPDDVETAAVVVGWSFVLVSVGAVLADPTGRGLSLRLSGVDLLDARRGDGDEVPPDER